MEDPKSPLCNLWLSTLRGAGVKANAFGDATGVINELFEAYPKAKRVDFGKRPIRLISEPTRTRNKEICFFRKDLQ